MRRSRARAFYLAVFALFSGECRVRAASPSSMQLGPDVCAIQSSAKVSDACASYNELNHLNDILQPYVRNLANNTDFFSYYRLNLYNKKCSFWREEDGMCGNVACAVTTLENEEEIPMIWRSEELSKLEGPKARHPGKKQQQELQRPLGGELGESVGESCVVEYDDECDERDYCVPEDESASAKGDYVSLVENPERFTGYSGPGAHQVWEAIYRENCFSKPLDGAGGEQSSTLPGLSMGFPGRSQNQAKAALDFKQVVKAQDLEGLDFDDECLEKRVFYRVISGMHASISTHLCYDYLNQTTGEWGPNVECYRNRLHYHPERISNLYFNYALVLRAVGKLRNYVQGYTFCTGDPTQDARTKEMITTLADVIPAGPKIFDESVMFQDQTVDGMSLKEDFRNRFRNVSRIMDCVGCDKCRLWGKLQTAGYGTALKVLFEFGNGGHTEEEKPLLRRTELVALINTLDKISTALKALEHFRFLLLEETEEEIPASPTERLSPPAVGSNPPIDFSDLDELDDFQDTQPDDHEETLGEIFWSELNLIIRTFKFIVRGWVELPRRVPGIVAVEVSRLWDFWLGKPIRPRNWEIRFPTHEEL